MSGTRQKIQYSLALEPVGQGETPASGYQGAEPLMAKPAPESPALTEQLMEEVCDREKSRQRVETRSPEQGQSWRGWDDHRRRQGLPARALAKHSVSITRGNLPAAAGQAGRNPQAGWRGQKARRALCGRQTDPAGLVAGSSEALGPHVFQAQLRLPTGALCPSGRGPSATIHCRGLQRRG